MSQTELAIKINGDNSKISRIERGIYNFKISSLLILAEALEIDAYELLKCKNIKNHQKHIWNSSEKNLTQSQKE